MSKFQVIWKETYKRNIKSMPFIIMLVMPIFIIGIINIVTSTINNEFKEAQVRTVGIVTKDSNLLTALKTDAPTFVFEHLTEEQAIAQLNQDTIDGYLAINRQANQDINVTLSKKPTSRDIDTTPIINSLTTVRLAEKSHELGIALHDVAILTATKVNVEVIKLNENSLKEGKAISDDQQSNKDMIRQAIATGAIVIIYIFLVMYSGLIGQEIATEKGTRVMEVILSSTDAKTHFLGKITGISLAILTQLACYLTLGIGYLVMKQDSLPLDIQQLWDLSGSMLLYSIIFILLGCFLYIVLAAFFGSIASKIEDVQKVLMPVIMFDVIGFYIGLFALQMPNNIVVKIASWFPLFTPMIVPFRIATDTISTLELWGTIIVTVVFSILLLRLAIQFYKASALVYSDKGPFQTLKQALSMIKAERQAR